MDIDEPEEEQLITSYGTWIAQESLNKPYGTCWVKRCQKDIIAYKNKGSQIFACKKHLDNSFTFSIEIPKINLDQLNLIYSQYNCSLTRRELITIINELKKENVELKQSLQNYELHTLMTNFSLKNEFK